MLGQRVGRRKGNVRNMVVWVGDYGCIQQGNGHAIQASSCSYKSDVYGSDQGVHLPTPITFELSSCLASSSLTASIGKKAIIAALDP